LTLFSVCANYGGTPSLAVPLSIQQGSPKNESRLLINGT
jgi:hypothetical protein